MFFIIFQSILIFNRHLQTSVFRFNRHPRTPTMINFKFLYNNPKIINPLFNVPKFKYRYLYHKLDICHLLLRKREEVDYMFQIFNSWFGIKEIKVYSLSFPILCLVIIITKHLVTGNNDLLLSFILNYKKILRNILITFYKWVMER